MKKTIMKMLGMEDFAYTSKEIKKMAYSSDWKERAFVASVSDEHLEKLKNDEEFAVRYKVASRGYASEELSRDEHWLVRLGVARTGKLLERFIKDPNWKVRKVLVEQGYQLEHFVNDENPEVSSEAKRLLGSKTYVIAQNFGTYKGNLYLRVWSNKNNKYEIQSGCYTASTLGEWYVKCEQRLNDTTAEKYKKIMENIIYQ